MNIWKKILSKLKDGNRVILIIVVAHKGSSPGKQGFKMMVADNGFIFGSIGGGLTEFTLVEKARIFLKKNRQNPKLIKQVHRPDEEDSSGMICSGEQWIVFYPINPKQIPLIQKIINSEKGVFTLSANAFKFDLNTLLSDNYSFQLNNDNSWEYKEKLNITPFLFIVGGGHVGLAIARLFETLDFEVIMFDNRKNLNTFNENIYSTKKVIDYENIRNYIPERENTFIVIATQGYDIDKLVFSQLIQNNYTYIGLLGSKSKIKTLFKKLAVEGVDPALFQKADAPVGLAIHSKTPAEIAVSIAAKIISVKNG